MTKVLPKDSAERLSILATYAYMYGNELGGSNLRTALIAELLVQCHGLDILKAIKLAREDAFDPRVREASVEAARLISQARTAEQDRRVSA